MLNQNKLINWGYLIIVGCFWLFFGGLTLFLGYKESFLWVNGFHNTVLDAIMPHLTHIGDSLILSGLLATFFYKQNKTVILLTITALVVSGVMTVTLKKFFFYDWNRPVLELGRSSVHAIEGHYEIHRSFPSGHATTAFAGLTGLATLFNPKLAIGTGVGIVAVIAAYSRVYLGTHFPADVLTGSLIGATTTWIILYCFEDKTQKLFRTLAVSYLRYLDLAIIYGGIVAMFAGLINRYANALIFS